MTTHNYNVCFLHVLFDGFSFSLPIDTISGETVYAEGSGRGKKEAVLECALTACRMLDAEGILRESRKGAFHTI